MKKVFTVGVYDLLHLGHIILFKNAKSLGDYLIVAVQEDNVIRKYKPHAQVSYNTDERVFMVESLKYVDEVVTYTSIDSIIDKIDFDVFVKGPDQIHEGFVNAVRWCEENGKEVVVMPRTEGISSSKLRELLKLNN